MAKKDPRLLTRFAESWVHKMNNIGNFFYNLTFPIRNWIDKNRKKLQYKQEKYYLSILQKDSTTKIDKSTFKLSIPQEQAYLHWNKSQKKLSFFSKRENIDDFIKNNTTKGIALTGIQRKFLRLRHQEESQWTYKARKDLWEVPTNIVILLIRSTAIIWRIIKIIPIYLGILSESKQLNKDYARITFKEMFKDSYQLLIAATVTSNTISTLSPVTTPINIGTNAITGIGSSTIKDQEVELSIIKKRFFVWKKRKYSLKVMKEKDPKMFKYLLELQSLKAHKKYQDEHSQKQIDIVEKEILKEYTHNKNNILEKLFGKNKNLTKDELTQIHTITSEKMKSLRGNLKRTAHRTATKNTLEGSIAKEQENNLKKEASSL